MTYRRHLTVYTIFLVSPFQVQGIYRVLRRGFAVVEVPIVFHEYPRGDSTLRYHGAKEAFRAA